MMDETDLLPHSVHLRMRNLLRHRELAFTEEERAVALKALQRATGRDLSIWHTDGLLDSFINAVLVLAEELKSTPLAKARPILNRFMALCRELEEQLARDARQCEDSRGMQARRKAKVLPFIEKAA